MSSIHDILVERLRDEEFDDVEVERIVEIIRGTIAISLDSDYDPNAIDNDLAWEHYEENNDDMEWD
jgi:hypothetical protein